MTSLSSRWFAIHDSPFQQESFGQHSLSVLLSGFAFSRCWVAPLGTIHDFVRKLHTRLLLGTPERFTARVQTSASVISDPAVCLSLSCNNPWSAGFGDEEAVEAGDDEEGDDVGDDKDI